MKPGRGLGLDGGGRRLLRGQLGGQAVALEAAVHAATRQLRVEAAPHRLDDVVERQHEAAAELDDQGFFPGSDRSGQAMWAGRAVGDVAAGFPARHGARRDAELARQHGVRGCTLLDIGAGVRRRVGIGVQSELHQRALPEVGVHSGVMAALGHTAQWVFKGC